MAERQAWCGTRELDRGLVCRHAAMSSATLATVDCTAQTQEPDKLPPTSARDLRLGYAAVAAWLWTTIGPQFEPSRQDDVAAKPS